MKNNPLHFIERFKGKKILVIGDFILDIYLKGNSTRLCPEAPVPVVDIEEKIVRPGGAANAAVQLSRLGAEVSLLALCGMDSDGYTARSLLKKELVDLSGLVMDKERDTIVKTRIISNYQTITRYDSGSEFGASDKSSQKIARFIKKNYSSFGAILLSDYNKGVITEVVIDALEKSRRMHPEVFIAVDSKRLEFFNDLAPDLVKPNHQEALAMISSEDRNMFGIGQGRKLAWQEFGKSLHAATNASLIALTLDNEGAILFERDQLVYTHDAMLTDYPQVSGAGDSYVSTLLLGLVAGADVRDAAGLASMAAHLAINNPGTHCCSHRELSASLALRTKHISGLQNLRNLCTLYKSEGKKIVFTNGCFDILHSGHVNFLTRASQLGDILIVGINNDDSIRRLKGPTRPINPLQDRMEVLEGLTMVNHLISFGDEKDDTPIDLISAVQPDVFVKGGDYHIKDLPEADTVIHYGGEVVLLSLIPDHSTTQIIKQISKATLAVA